jgi:peroxiredoxin family protein
MKKHKKKLCEEVKVAISISRDLHKRLKLMACSADMTIKEIVSDLIRERLEDVEGIL